MRAVLVVGGRGVRLRPFTTSIPKPLVPLGGEIPILEVLLRQLRRHGVERVTLATGHLGHLIRSYVGDGSAWNLDVDYWQETAPLGTVGPLLEHLDELPEDFLLLNGDLLSDIDFGALMSFHREAGGDVTVAASKRSVDIEFGVLDTEGTKLCGFREKPSLDYLVNMGIYVIARSALEEFQAGEPLGADELVARQIAAGGANVFHFDGYWLDIGRPEDYDRANAEFPKLRSLLLDDTVDSLIDLTVKGPLAGLPTRPGEIGFPVALPAVAAS
jgi:NDP-mannose synthase